MPAEVESMFYVREVPWHGLGTNVEEALSSNEALIAAGLDWNVIHEAIETLGLAQNYMKQLEKEMLSFHHIKIDDDKLQKFINILIPKPPNASSIKSDNIDKIHEDICTRFYQAPDLTNMEQTGYRFLNAISDHETHFTPFRSTDSYQENLFLRTIEKPILLDKSFALLKEAA